MQVKALLANVLALVVAAVAAEGIVRVALHPALDYSSEFTPGPYCVSPTGEVTFACSDRHGVMHPLGTKSYLPYVTNDEGYRGPYGSPGGRGDVEKVVLVGGQSETWGEGLSDHDTIGAVLARSSSAAMDIHVFALPGVSTAQSWNLYKLSREAAERPDRIVLMIYDGERSARRQQTAINGRLFAGGFAVLYGWLYPLPKWLQAASNSYLLVRSIDSMRGSLSQLVFRAKRTFDKAAAQLGLESADTAPSSLADTGNQEFIRKVVQEAQALHAGLSVVFLPGARRIWSVNVDAIEHDLPDVRFIDVDAKAVALGLYPAQTFPDGHYNPTLAHFIGAEISRSLCLKDPDSNASAEAGNGEKRCSFSASSLSSPRD